MLMYCQPPAQQVALPAAELPLLPGSNPLILGTYQWTLARSPSLQQVVRELARADRKARYRLIPGLGDGYTFVVTPVNEEYEIDIEVPVLPWRQCGDALEPWIASSLFMVLEVVKNEKYRAHSRQNILTFLPGSVSASFIFQSKVKKELQASDPERLKDLPDGARIYHSHFAPTLLSDRKQRWLPTTLSPPEPAAPKRNPGPGSPE